MASDGLRAVVVTDLDGKPAGIVSERDLVVRGLAWNRPLDTPVEAVMTPEVVTADAAAPARSVHQLLQAHGIRQVPLVDRGRLVGVVDRADVGDEATLARVTAIGGCPHCGSDWLRPVATADATNLLCLACGACWRLHAGRLTRVEPRSCSGCPEHNFCRFPLIDYGVDIARFPASSS
jgi:CBS-domain-containing membrane protein